MAASSWYKIWLKAHVEFFFSLTFHKGKDAIVPGSRRYPGNLTKIYNQILYFRI